MDDVDYLQTAMERAINDVLLAKGPAPLAMSGTEIVSAVADRMLQAVGREQRYLFVDVTAEAGPDGKDMQVPIDEDMSDAELYWEDITRGRTPASVSGARPVLVIMYGPPGSGKSSRCLPVVMQQKGWKLEDFVTLDPDACRMYCREYRLSISGAHAAKVGSVKSVFGPRLTPTPWASPDGRFHEDGYTVDGKYLALVHAVRRSQFLVRKKMLWGHKVVEMTDAFVDRALVGGYNVIYDTMGDEPNRFLRELMRRARSQHDYQVVVCGSYVPWEDVVRRSEARVSTEGRCLDVDLARLKFDRMFPMAAGLAAGDVDESHHERFVKLEDDALEPAPFAGGELRPGDERYLYDNSGQAPVLRRHDITIEVSSESAMGHFDRELFMARAAVEMAMPPPAANDEAKPPAPVEQAASDPSAVHTDASAEAKPGETPSQTLGDWFHSWLPTRDKAVEHVRIDQPTARLDAPPEVAADPTLTAEEAPSQTMGDWFRSWLPGRDESADAAPAGGESAMSSSDGTSDAVGRQDELTAREAKEAPTAAPRTAAPTAASPASAASPPPPVTTPMSSRRADAVKASAQPNLFNSLMSAVTNAPKSWFAPGGEKDKNGAAPSPVTTPAYFTILPVSSAPWKAVKQPIEVPPLPILTSRRQGYGSAQPSRSLSAKGPRSIRGAIIPQTPRGRAVAASERAKRDPEEPLDPSARRRLTAGALWLNEIKLRHCSPRNRSAEADLDAFRFQPVSAGTPRDAQTGRALAPQELVEFFKTKVDGGVGMKDSMPLVHVTRGELSRSQGFKMQDSLASSRKNTSRSASGSTTPGSSSRQPPKYLNDLRNKAQLRAGGAILNFDA